MLYTVLRWVASISLRWFYRRVDVVGAEHVPTRAPLLVAANHPNQLVDVLLVGCAVPRPVTVTGKAVLLDNPILRPVLRRLPFVPLRRASDERQKGKAAGGVAADPSRNADAFQAVTDALARGAAVLVFPEGISHGASELAPVKTGVARMALQARDQGGLRDVHILPVGLTFERKEQPRTRVLVEIGAPIALDRWPGDGAPVEALTREVDARLRAVTLNFPTDDAAARARLVGETLAGIFAEPRPVGESDLSLAEQVRLTRRSEEARRRLAARPGAGARVQEFERRLQAFGDELADRGIELADLEISLGTRKGAWFAVREGAMAAVAGPLALWGRVNHWLPLRLARALARRSSRTPQDPAQHTLVVGLVAVPLFYAAQTAAVWLVAGGWWALLYLASLIPSASWDLRYQDRRRRAVRRVHAYRLLRGDRPLRARLRDEAAWLRQEAAELERLAGGA
jgi:1-acyl-sn-glycerol-3-phosphate acyltransferase